MHLKKHFTKTDLLVILAVFCVIGILIIPALSTNSDRRAPHPCNINLKKISIAMQMYFSDGSETVFPTNTKFSYLDQNSHIAKVFGLDASILTCPAKRKQGGNVYSIDKTIQGLEISKWERTDSLIGYDSTKKGNVDVHIPANKAYGLFGDGHIEPILENKERAHK